ncbi:UDP-N-acetylglucosamine transferase subunit ALG13 homolog isoform X2 [Strongylocentrotus purpuratus]|uniref:UDP-N-acetylglucosamine transferase subunit ALG13 n=1 Tax=Strongylocentrotus purpuratus TaxID=7668 RepID=A0A7M7N1W8_STRPU|nr:UDP-N-acetylglucosamine transferase subunit ALG13 homolog isoform X2 [Strongylocentrotus purpuratus]
MATQGKIVFVTILKRLGYSKVILQIGRGNIEPQQINQPDFCLEAYRYKDSIAEDIYNADLVISHAGAGSCLETLGARKPLLVVINELLMGNHQLELADQLCKDEHLFHTTPSKLAHDLETMDFSLLKPFPPCDPSNFSSFLDKALGVS